MLRTKGVVIVAFQMLRFRMVQKIAAVVEGFCEHGRRGFLCARSSSVSVEHHLLQLPISTQQHVCAMQSCRCEDVPSNSRLGKSLAPLDFVHCTGIGRFRRVGHPSIMNNKQRNHLLLFSRYNPCFSPLIPGFCREILKEILHLTILFLILLLIESSNLHLTC